MAKSNSFTVYTDCRLTNDPETRKAGDKDLLSFTIADNPGDEKSETKWVRVTVSGKLAEVLSALKKGDRVNVVGKETFNTYDKKDGTTGVGFDVKFPMSVTRVYTDQLSPVAEDKPEPPAKKGPGRPKKVVTPPWEDDAE